MLNAAYARELTSQALAAEYEKFCQRVANAIAFAARKGESDACVGGLTTVKNVEYAKRIIPLLIAEGYDVKFDNRNNCLQIAW